MFVFGCTFFLAMNLNRKINKRNSKKINKSAMMAADDNSDQGREYNHNESFWDKMNQSDVMTVVSRQQNITVEIEKK